MEINLKGQWDDINIIQFELLPIKGLPNAVI